MPGPGRVALRQTVPASIACALLALAACGGHAPGSTSPSSAPPLNLIASATTSSSAVLVGAGDIASCGMPGAEATAELLDNIPGTVIALGDNAYMSGSESEYRNCYEPTWGRHRSRTRPVPGNHEYATALASGYFSYYGTNAGSTIAGYYSYRAGPWLVLALNSEAPVGIGSAQLEWVREQLVGTAAPCTLAYWHRPRFSSGPNGGNADLQDLWRLLYDLDVDVVINGHDHLYERFAPQDPSGRPDSARGIRQFTVGTGGSPLSPIRSTAANSEMIVSAWGVGRFTLENGRYEWEFVPAGGGAFRDTGTGVCH